MLVSAKIRQEITNLSTRGEELQCKEKMSNEEIAEMKVIVNRLKELEIELQNAETIEAAKRAVTATAQATKPAIARSIGEHFKNAAAEQVKQRGQRYTIQVQEEFKNTHLTTGTPSPAGTFDPALGTVDKTIVQQYNEPTIYDLFSQGTMSGQSITYFVQTGVKVRKGTTAEGAVKNQRTYTYTSRTDNLSKVTGFIKLSEEMMEDLDFVVSDINNRLVVDVDLDKQSQLISGDGTGTNLQGLLNRTGIQTETAANAADNADALYRAITKIQTATGRRADAIVLHPMDYQKLRLMKDANGQYMGGGFFQGQYGAGVNAIDQPIWTKRVVQSSEIPQGTAIVGAFRQGGTVYTKGGMRIAATNTNEDDFIKNMVTVRGEERIALAVRLPEAFVKVTLIP